MIKEQIKLKANKLEVYNEVAKTTAYVGSKQMTADEHAYERMFTTDEDRLMLERYFAEACKEVVNSLPTSYIVEVSDYNTGTGIDLNSDFLLTLEVPETFPDNLTASVEASLFFYLTTYITSQWFALQKSDMAIIYKEKSDVFKKDISVMLHRRTRPVRRKPRPF